MEEQKEEEVKDIIPSFDHSEIATEKGLMATLMRFEKMKRESCMPAIVTAVNADHTVDLYILVRKKIPTVKGPVFQTRKELKNIPWMQMRHGSYAIDWPIKRGDTGWLFAADRANGYTRLENAKENVDENKGPCDLEADGLCEYTYGMFIPDSWFDDDRYHENKTLTIRGLQKDCSIDLIIDDPDKKKKYLKKFSVRHDGLYLDDKPFEGGGGMNLISGDYSNIVFTPITDGYYAGKTKIDVFYK